MSNGGIEDVFGLEHLVTNAMLYVMKDSFASSVWYYNGLIREGGVFLPPGERIEVPTAYANFPNDALAPVPPRSRIELSYNVVRWTDMPTGGHFAAMEQPDLFSADVRAWAMEVWPTA